MTVAIYGVSKRVAMMWRKGAGSAGRLTLGRHEISRISFRRNRLGEVLIVPGHFDEGTCTADHLGLVVG